MNPCRNVLTREQADALFIHVPEAGVIVRKVTTGQTAKKGSVIPSRQVEINGKTYCVKKTAWLLLHGEFPLSPVFCLDGNDSNLKDDNLMILPRLKRESDLPSKLDDLRRLLNYDTQTGLISWTAFVGGNAPGDMAGWDHSEGYKCVSVFGRKIYAHRLAYLLVTGSFPESVIDHINGDRVDNRWDNLRSVEQRTNVENRTSAVNENSASGLLGVHWNKQRQKWQAQIKSHGKKKHVGFFLDKHEAHQAYLKTKREIHKGCTI